MSRISTALVVGPVQFSFCGDEGAIVHYPDWAYRDFFLGNDCSGLAKDTVSLPVRLHAGTSALPGREPDFMSGSNWGMWDSEDSMQFCSGFAHRTRPRVACVVTKSLDACDLHVEGSLSDSPLKYPMDQILTWGLLGRCNGLLLHAAGVVRDGVGYVLAGRSGAGKSTLSGFCQDSGWEILNDDRVIVHPDRETGAWLVSGTPWHGSGRFACNRTVPLAGIYLLAQDTINAVRPLAEQESRYLLMDVAGIAWFSEAWSQAALDTLVRICSEVRVLRLHFTRSAAAVECMEAAA